MTTRREVVAPDKAEAFEERVAICMYDGELSEADAVRVAMGCEFPDIPEFMAEVADVFELERFEAVVFRVEDEQVWPPK